jgi:YD repeat-containing protein
MDTVGLIERIAAGDLSEDEQLALLAQVETSIQLRKQAKQVKEELDTYEAAVEVIAQTINDHKTDVDNALKEVYSYVRQPGPMGRDGKDGKIGKDGRDGLDGRDGVNGKDGVDGVDGKDGVSIVDVYVAADGSLVCVLSDGREIDTGPLLEAGTGSNTNVSVSSWAGYSTEELKQTFIYNTFETVSKNLASSGGTLAYDANGDLITITYLNGIIKTLAYDANGDLISLTLSGSTPEGIDLVKTFSYDANGDLVTFVYS